MSADDKRGYLGEKNTDKSTREMKVHVHFAVVNIRHTVIMRRLYSFWRLERCISQLLAITDFLWFLYIQLLDGCNAH